MTVTTIVDHSKRRIFVKAFGSITATDILSHIEEERSAGILSYSELVDARGYVPDFSSEQLHTIVDRLRSLSGHHDIGPIAIVVDTDLGYGMLRMLEMFVEDHCALRPFRQLEEAEQWLSEQTKSTS